MPAALAAACAVLAGCRDPTQIELTLTTDIACEERPATQITTAERLASFDAAVVDTSLCSSGGRIGTLVSVPSEDKDAKVAFQVVMGVGKTADECVDDEFVGGCIVARRALRYIPHTPLYLPIGLRAGCLDRPCEPNETCANGACIDATIEDAADCATPSGCRLDDGTPPAPPDPIYGPFAQTAYAKPSTTGGWFGRHVAAWGDRFAVGAIWQAGGGAVYTYRRDGAAWVLEGALTPGGAELGTSMAMSADTLIVGANHWSSTGSNEEGRVWMYRLVSDAWVLEGDIASTVREEHLGHSIAISGDVAAIGAPYWDDGGPYRRGRVVIAERSGTTWSIADSVQSSDVASYSIFGRSVALEGTTLVVGSPHHDSYRGAVYVFEYTGGTWVERAKLAPASGAEELFGEHVAIHQGRIAVGAPMGDANPGATEPNETPLQFGAGAVYLYVQDQGTWREEARLTLDTPSFGDEFGYRISLWGDRLAVGVHQDDDFGNDAGSVALFARDDQGSWAEEALLAAENAEAGDVFGYGVALHENVLVVSAPDEDGAMGAGPSDNSDMGAGAVYVFEASAVE